MIRAILAFVCFLSIIAFLVFLIKYFIARIKGTDAGKFVTLMIVSCVFFWISFFAVGISSLGFAETEEKEPSAENVTDQESSVTREETERSEGGETGSSGPAEETEQETTQWVELSEIPDYTDRPSYDINNGSPYFSKTDLSIYDTFESYGELDEYGRCTAASALLSKETMPTEGRGPIGSIQPTGWHTVKYENIADLYLYNRCHLIAYELSGQNDNIKNLITGTRYMNIEGMLPYENKVADYLRSTDNHVLYRVTPVFEGKNLVASGVVIEAESIEDNGRGISICTYCYNVQPGIMINYETGDSELTEEAKTEIAKEKSAEKASKAEAESKVVEEQHSSEETGVLALDPEPVPDPGTGDRALDNSGTDKSSVPGDDSNFNLYNNPDQQNTSSMYVLNTSSHKIHHPDCDSVPTIAPQNYATSDLSIAELEAQGYRKCGKCFK